MLQAHGAQAFIEVAEVRPGLRGVVASTDIEADKVVVVLPHDLAIPLATSVAPAPVRWLLNTAPSWVFSGSDLHDQASPAS